MNHLPQASYPLCHPYRRPATLYYGTIVLCTLQTLLGQLSSPMNNLSCEPENQENPIEMKMMVILKYGTV